MLIQSRKETPYTAIFKLGSGEEFICKVMNETDDFYSVTKPLTLGQTQQGVQFIPLLMLADPDKSVEIPKPVIIGIPGTEVESQYESLVTGIALPKKSKIIS